MKDGTLSTEYMASFSMELYLILQGGISLDEGVAILREGESDRDTYQVLTQMYTVLQEGFPLHMALAQCERFPQYMIDMVRVGEETGNLDRSLKGLANYYTRQEQLVRTLRKAVLYPAVLLAMLTAVMVVLIVEVLPMFNDVYNQLGGTMSGLGAGILSFGILLKRYWIVAILVVAMVVIGVVLWAQHANKSGGRVLLSKKLGEKVATAKLASALSMALRSGLDLDMTMAMAADLTQHPHLHQRVKRCGEKMIAGQSFEQSITEEKLFSVLHCRMLGVGVKTGATDQVMEEVALRCDSEAQDAIDHFVGNVEPTLVVVMCVLVGIVLLSVMLPLANIMASLG